MAISDSVMQQSWDMMRVRKRLLKDMFKYNYYIKSVNLFHPLELN